MISKGKPLNRPIQISKNTTEQRFKTTILKTSKQFMMDRKQGSPLPNTEDVDALAKNFNEFFYTKNPEYQENNSFNSQPTSPKEVHHEHV